MFHERIHASTHRNGGLITTKVSSVFAIVCTWHHVLTSYGWFGLVCVRRCYLSTNWTEASLKYSSDSNGGGGYVCMDCKIKCMCMRISVTGVQWPCHSVVHAQGWQFRLKTCHSTLPRKHPRERGSVSRVEDRAVDMCASVCGTCK